MKRIIQHVQSALAVAVLLTVFLIELVWMDVDDDTAIYRAVGVHEQRVAGQVQAEQNGEEVADVWPEIDFCFQCIPILEKMDLFRQQ